MPSCRLRSLEGRLLLFAVALLAAVLAELFGGLAAEGIFRLSFIAYLFFGMNSFLDALRPAGLRKPPAYASGDKAEKS